MLVFLVDMAGYLHYIKLKKKKELNLRENLARENLQKKKKNLRKKKKKKIKIRKNLKIKNKKKKKKNLRKGMQC